MYLTVSDGKKKTTKQKTAFFPNPLQKNMPHVCPVRLYIAEFSYYKSYRLSVFHDFSRSLTPAWEKKINENAVKQLGSIWKVCYNSESVSSSRG